MSSIEGFNFFFICLFILNFTFRFSFLEHLPKLLLMALLFEILENLSAFVILYYFPSIPADYARFRSKCVACKLGCWLLFCGLSIGSLFNVLKQVSCIYRLLMNFVEEIFIFNDVPWFFFELFFFFRQANNK